ncbi:hypothetical protein WG954_08555 [Lacibacter sp. H375]|uniref:hypothetical protein n=1 Tax=Lacibacter sp. H375 TaxID=3133424 RepID=UPI0030BF15D1
MIDNFYLALAAILLLPLIPAYIIYKFLPESETNVEGPYKKLNLKLKGAFAGYFLLVLLSLGLQYVTMSSSDGKKIEQLTRSINDSTVLLQTYRSQIEASKNPVIDWKIKGIVAPGEKEGTRFFFDDGTTLKNPDGSFELIKRSIAAHGKANPPKWICVYNPVTGYQVISLNREIPHPDIASYNVSFNDEHHEILIRKIIDINSAAKDSIVAVAGFLEKNPELKAKFIQVNPDFFDKADRAKIIRDRNRLVHLPVKQ